MKANQNNTLLMLIPTYNKSYWDWDVNRIVLTSLWFSILDKYKLLVCIIESVMEKDCNIDPM